METKEEKRIRKEEKRQKKLEKKQKRNATDINSSKTQGEQNDGKSDGGLAKRKELEEIEIDLKGEIPLNRKQQRLLKKGKFDLDKLNAQNPPPRAETELEPGESESGKSKYGVWIGNLSFDSIKQDILNFITSKTNILESQVKRVNLPKKGDKIKGFCYVDFETQDHVDQVIGLSEQGLNGRKLLIKNANNFEGRPEAHKQSNSLVNASKNPPSRILFVGNLSFDTTEELLREHFKPCGEIVRIRMATFEDSGKCKGFAFVDFKDETGATNALTTKLTRNFINRPLRMEYGEDRSKRQPKRRFDEQESSARERVMEESDPPPKPQTPHVFKTKPKPEKRLKSSVALASAQRASAAIVPSSGKKITFD